MEDERLKVSKVGRCHSWVDTDHDPSLTLGRVEPRAFADVFALLLAQLQFAGNVTRGYTSMRVGLLQQPALKGPEHRLVIPITRASFQVSRIVVDMEKCRRGGSHPISRDRS